MTTFLVWFDNNPNKTAPEIIAAGVKRFMQKFGVVPNMVQMMPQVAATLPAKIGRIKIEGRAAALRNHYWIGREGVELTSGPR